MGETRDEAETLSFKLAAQDRQIKTLLLALKPFGDAWRRYQPELKRQERCRSDCRGVDIIYHAVSCAAWAEAMRLTEDLTVDVRSSGELENGDAG